MLTKGSFRSLRNAGVALASEAYGDAFGKRLNAQASSFVSRSLPESTIAVTELKYDSPQFSLSRPPVEEHAFLVTVFFDNFERYECWEDDKAATPTRIRRGEAVIDDLRRKPVIHLNGKFHTAHFYMPAAT